MIPNIDPHKIDKYLPKLLNGEAYKLESYIPNILSTSGIMERETYDYRTTQFRKKDPNTYNTKIASVLHRINEMKQKKQELILAFAELKIATDQHYEKSKTPY